MTKVFLLLMVIAGVCYLKSILMRGKKSKANNLSSAIRCSFLETNKDESWHLRG
jgi:hypothetical protein